MNAQPGSTELRPRRQVRTRLRLAWLPMLLLAVFLPAVTTALRAQDTASDNPTGPSGDYNGEVTTAGSYDPYTQNAKRAVTDLVVPGSNGTYPLAFARIYNSAEPLVANEPRVLGDGGNWRHSYMWTLAPAANSYNVAYPDGGVVTFRPGRSNAPSGEYSTYWRGPAGTQDRLEVNGGSVCLHKSDGGLINFGGNLRPLSIVDPYGATTTLTYNGTLLTQVTEPGGRSLQFGYTTYDEEVYDDGDGHTVDWSWVLLTQVTASTGQYVTYSYDDTGDRAVPATSQNPYGYTVPYKTLTSVTYNSDPSTSGGSVQAGYTYEYAGGGIPVLKTAHDPHYAGAMVNIQYLYTSTGSGSIQAEQNLTSQGAVSSLGRGYNAGVLTSTETRGDTSIYGGAITRTFTYGEATINGGASNAKASQLTTSTDFEGNPTYLSYYGPGSGNGEGNLFSVTDALGHSTLYGHEPYAGKVYAMELPDGRVRFWNWLSKDLSTALQPYYLYQYADERGQTTTYHRYANTGLVNQIDYPDGGHEYFSYTGFSCNGNAFYKVQCHTDQRGAQTIYGYDETDVNHGGSGQGHMGLLTSVTRSYSDSTNTLRQERTVLYYDALDRLTQSVDPRGVTTQFAYNGRHQLTTTTHVADGTAVGSYYDDVGNCVYTVDEFGHGTSTYYDEYRRVTSVVQSVNDGSNTYHIANFAYDPRNYGSSSLSSATSHTRSQWSVSWAQSGKGTERVFSPNGWRKRTYSGIGIAYGGPNGSVYVGGGPGCVYDYVDYSSTGQMLSYTDTQGQASTFTYDACGRKTSATDPNGHVSTWTYYTAQDNASYQGWLKSVTTPGPDLVNYPTVTTTYTGYDVMGRVTATLDPYNHTFQSSYDYAGDLTAQTDGDQASGQHNTGYGYDQLGRKASITTRPPARKRNGPTTPAATCTPSRTTPARRAPMATTGATAARATVGTTGPPRPSATPTTPPAG